MPQLDRLLSVMMSQRATALRLDEAELAELEIAGAPRPVTKTPLTGQQVLTLLREVAPSDALSAIDAGTPTTFSYISVEGAFSVQTMREGNRWRARVTVDESHQRERMQEFKLPETADEPALRRTPVAGTPPMLSAVMSRAESNGANGDVISAFEGIERARNTLDALLRTTVQRGASDLHLRCGEPPIIRQHGEMVRFEQPALEPEELEAMLRSIMPERNRQEYTETNDTDYAYEIEGVARFRANALKDRKGPAAVFRQIPATVVTVEQMNITPEVQRLCQLNKGLVLVTGPTGSGKSTTLCSLIDLVNRSRSDHVITIEDPIEFVHPNKRCIITQRQVGVHTNSFKSALRAALREDPDIILVGELRDLETVSIAIETAETGHLVFGTLHTTTAAGTIDRIIDQFPADRQAQIRVMLAESLKGVISQTLCKKIGGGRAAAREVLLTIPAVTNLIREGKTFQIPSVMQTSKRLGMVTLNDALLELVDSGQVEPQEAYSKAVEKSGFIASLKSRGVDTGFAETDQPKEPPKPAPAGKR
jgi:twitching motility protein PilT